jgi:L-ascorbate metabolism protein UlaG (beta-lactamase superfamily)
MGKQEVKIQYLYHSGFRVETERHILIFDYYQGPVDLGDSRKETYVFCSHSHPDHFNPIIFSWQKQKENIRYILSHDLPPNKLPDQALVLSPYQEIQTGDLRVKAFGSTDEGVSFLVRDLRRSIFHAGDLNWWYWWRDIPQEIAKAEVLFKEEIARIKGEQVDIAFFPVDSRLEHNYGVGADYFIREIAPRFLIPMHFGDDLATPVKYAEKMQESPTKVIKIAARGQEFVLPI